MEKLEFSQREISQSEFPIEGLMNHPILSTGHINLMIFGFICYIFILKERHGWDCELR